MVKCAVVGASGYIGGELVRLLLQHSEVEIVSVTAREAAGLPIEAVHPNLRGCGLVFSREVQGADIVFLALPNGESMRFLNEHAYLLDRCRVIDTSSDFRLHDQAEYEKYYRGAHLAWQYVERFVYGQPELFQELLLKQHHIAMPGCFATALILSLYPIAAAGLDETVFVSAVTGSSGSGIKVKEKTHHPFRSDSLYAYEKFTHRHVPEVKQAIYEKTGRRLDLTFQPHSGPFVRGIFSTSMVKMNSEVSTEELRAIYQKCYGTEGFVRLLSESPNIKYVRGTNYCDISVKCDGRTAIVTAAIDNLIKGGAGQAVQCLNLVCGFRKDMGLSSYAINP